jgi:signal peptidase I
MTAPSQEAYKCSLAAEVLQSTGRLQLRASGISMLPTLWPGDCLTIQSYNFEQAQPGDLVLYTRSGLFFIHRVKRKCRPGEETFLITRGDCMAEEDPPIQERDLLGKVTVIHRNGLRITPRQKLSPARLLISWLLCHCSFLLRATLRLHADGNFEWSFDSSTACG